MVLLYTAFSPPVFPTERRVEKESKDHTDWCLRNSRSGLQITSPLIGYPVSSLSIEVSLISWHGSGVFPLFCRSIFNVSMSGHSNIFIFNSLKLLMLIDTPHCKQDLHNEYWQQVLESKKYTFLSFVLGWMVRYAR